MVIRVVKKRQFWVVNSVVKKTLFCVVISVVKKIHFWVIISVVLVWLKRGSFRWLLG